MVRLRAALDKLADGVDVPKGPSGEPRPPGLRHRACAADDGLVPTFARSLTQLAGLRPAAICRLALAVGSTAAMSAALLLAAAPAGALVTKVASTKVGLQPRSISLAPGAAEGEGATFANSTGNVVLQGSTSEYAIYWDPEKPTRFDSEWLVNLDGFFQAFGEAHVDTPFGVLAQYRDRSNAVAPFHALFKGSYSDTVKFPSGKCTDPANPAFLCLTDAQLREQLQSFIATHDLPKGMGTVYYLLTPPGVAVCLDAGKATGHCSDYAESNKESYENSFCSYHGDINLDSAPEGDANTILYAAIPWTANTGAFDCQDGGWNPEKHFEKREAPKEETKKEEEARQKTLEEDPPKKRLEEEAARRLEGPHIEEPNQETGEDVHPAAALSDLIVNQIAEEEMNTVTDPLLNAWQDTRGEEATDLCRNFFASTAGENGSGGEIAGSVVANPLTEAGTLSNVTVGPHRYYINNVFTLATDGCSGGPGLIASFTAPNPVNAGEIIGVDGMESTVSLIEGKAFGPTGPPTTTYATFKWNFGDGTPEVEGFAPGAPTCEAPWLSPCAASAFHSYQYGGKYNVTLMITDVAGNTTSVTHEVTVDGPLPPLPPSSPTSPSGGSPAAGTSTAGGSSGSPGAGSTPKPIPGPVATQAVVSHSLSKALRNGLVISYSVNEQVAGQFQVLLASSVAKRIGLHGAAATGLPPGTAPQIVIAKAILITTKGGRNTVKILFGKKTAAKLRKLRKVTLTIRLVVRNASSHSPLSTTVISTVTLSH